MVLALLISYLAALVSPEKLWIPAIFGLFYPAILIINLLFVVYWLFLRKAYFLISLVIILIGFGKINNLFNFNTKGISNSSEIKSFKICSYNTRLFDIFNWSKDEETPKKIIDLIKNEEANIICLQEFRTETQGLLRENNLRKNFGQKKFSHIVYLNNNRGGGQKHGIATYSAFPIINKGEIRFENSSNITIFSDLITFGDTIRIYNNHLQSIRIRQKELDLFNNNDEQKNNKERISNIFNILKKIKNANKQRARQAEIIKKHISECKYAVVVCGDFNDTPYSYTYKTVKGKLDDAFNKSGIGFGTTYRNNLFSFRIDYILHQNSFNSNYFRTNKTRLSDHNLISCIISKKAD